MLLPNENHPVVYYKNSLAYDFAYSCIGSVRAGTVGGHQTREAPCSHRNAAETAQAILQGPWLNEMPCAATESRRIARCKAIYAELK